MEKLLNKLIEKGWKPRWEKVNKVIKTWIDEFGDGYVLFDGELNWYKQRWCNMTELVSKWSWLWQFVCENGMVKDENLKYTENDLFNYYQDNYHYRIIASALCDEDKLEEFLLNSIKLD